MIETAREMYVAFLHGIQKEDAEGVPPDKFKYWINKAQEEWISERAKQFDSDQKRIDDLHVLRTERVIPINGTRSLKAVTDTGMATLKLIEGTSVTQGDGTMIIAEETYFSQSGLAFAGAGTNAGAIDAVTGAVTDAEVGDVYYAKVTYSELEQSDGTNDPVVYKITVGATLLGTHTSGIYDAADAVAWNTAAGESIETSPATSFTDYRFLIPNDYPNPRYFRLLNVMFKVTYQNNTLHDNGTISTSWQRAGLMKADERADIYQNAYRYPTDEKMYYRFVGPHMELINETDSTPLTAKMEYLKYPDEIVYYEPNSDNNDRNCELAPVQQKEIVDMAVMMYLEATANPRYQSQVVEDQKRNQFE